LSVTRFTLHTFSLQSRLASIPDTSGLYSPLSSYSSFTPWPLRERSAVF
jgi:hypothetical protein